MSTLATSPPRRPATEWVRCEQCASLVYAKRFARALQVCPNCGRHARLGAPARLESLLDPGSAQALEDPRCVHDPLEFTDTRPYRERLREARVRTGLDEAVLCVRGTVEGRALVVAAMDFRFLGGSLGCGVGARVAHAAQVACVEGIPLLLVTASGGARMQEGVLSLMQMAKTAQALGDLDEAGVLSISLITDPTYGGVAASFATLTDIVLTEPGARLGFAGPRVIEQTTGEQLPDGFQTAEFLLEHGMVDGVVPRAAMRATLAMLLDLHHRPRVALDAGRRETSEPVHDRARRVLPGRAAFEGVRLARHPGRPTTLDYAHQLLEDFHELHGDRIGADCPAVVGGPGRLDGMPVMLIGHEKGGDDLGERQRRNFGMPSPAGYRKAARLMRLAAKLRLPVVTLIDTPGAHPGPDAERGGQAAAIAENLRLMSRLPVPVVAVVTGEGGSGGALALGVADRVLISEHGVYSVISPEGCAAILWKDPQAAPAAAAALRMHASELLRMGVVDTVVPEPSGGAHLDHAQAALLLRQALCPVLGDLAARTPEQLLRDRRTRFHRFGTAPSAEGSPACGVDGRAGSGESRDAVGTGSSGPASGPEVFDG